MTQDWVKKIRWSARGVKEVLEEPAALARFLKEGARFPRELARGWEQLSQVIA
jgi:hypothetical protein